MSAATHAAGLDPVLDADRLREIAELDLLSPEVAPLLQDAARAAAERLGLPVGLVSVVLDDAQHFAASHGLSGWLAEAGGTPVEWSFCAHAVRAGEPFVVEDATTHPLVKDNPLVQVDGIRCYAGIPLISSRGYALGSFCVIGAEQRSFSPDELQLLRDMASDVVVRLESRRTA